MDQKNILAQALYFIQKQRRHRWWLRAVTGMAAVVVFITTYLLILPAITMENSELEVTAASSLAALGETIDTEIYAAADNSRPETTFVLAADGDNAGLEESQLDFDEEDIAVVETAEGQDIKLHREYTEDGMVRYWFTLEREETAHFSLAWVNGADRYRTEEIEEEIPSEDESLPESPETDSPATGSNAVYAAVSCSRIYNETIFMQTDGTGRLSLSRHEAPLVADAAIKATDSNARPEEEPAESAPEHEDSSDMEEGVEEDETLENDIVDETEEETVDRPELVLEQEGDWEQEGFLTLSFGYGRSKEDAQRHTDDFLTLSWSEEPPLEIPENASSWATVEKDGFLATDSDAEMMLFLDAEESGGHDFGQNITNVTVSKLENGQWKPGAEFTDGDYVQVRIAYSLPQGIVGSGNKEIHYQLPDGITLKEGTDGTVYDGTTPVGTYTITPDGLIRIVFNDSFADERPFTGTIQFQGTAHAGENGGDNKIDFGAGGSITVKPNPKPTDVRVKKEGSYNKEDGKLHYTLTVSTTQGTSGTITVKDAFQSGNAHYDKDSFQIVKADTNGQTTPVTGYAPTISKDNWDGAPENFTITGLPALNAGESYRINYTATPDKPSGATTGESSVSNGVSATTSGGDSGNYWCNVTISKKMIEKQGQYDAATGMIKWTITLNPDHRDISGWTLKDQITTSEGITATMPQKVTITGSNGDKREVELPYTFPQGSTDSYTITYQTKVEGLEPGESTTVTNHATIDGDGEHYEGGASVWPSSSDYSVRKSYGWHDTAQDDKDIGEYQWNSEIDVPGTFGIEALDKITYTDKLHDLESGGTTIEGSHYITAAQLGALTVKANGTPLMRGEDYVLYAPNGTEITDFAGDARYTGFQIKFTETAVDKVRGRKISLQYSTTVDYTKLTAGNTYIIRNTGSIPNHDSTGETDYEKPGKLEKQASATGTAGSFAGDGVKVDYTASGGVIHYRVLLHTDENTKGDITLKDALPKGATFVEGSAKLKFYYNDNHETDEISWWDTGGEHKYTCAENLTLSETDGVVTFTIRDGYNGDYHAGTNGVKPHVLALYYDLSIKDDPIWQENPGLESHPYRNEVTWGDQSTGTDVTVDRDVPELAKTGAQLPQYDENGEPMKDSQGNIILSNTVRYYVTINQGGKDLDPTRDVLELKDTLTLPANAAGAELNVGSVHLYQYDPNAGEQNYCGKEINSARYTYVYDQASRTLTFTVPDSTAMVLVYEYMIDRGTAAGDLQLSNKAELTGVAGGSTNNDISFKEVSSSATVTKRSLTVYKVDGDNFGKSLPGAEFRLESYANNTWTKAAELTTDDAGKIVLNLTGDDGKLVYQPDTLYRLTETAAPTGYAKDDTPHYFVWIDGKETAEDCKEKMASVLQSAQVQEKDVLFIANSSAIYVPNTSTTLTVQKVWVDPDGGEMANPGVDSIKVKLYQQPVKTNAVTVTFYNPNNGGAITSIDVASGSSLTVNVSTWSALEYTVNGGQTQTVNPTNGNVLFELDRINGDTTVALNQWLTASNFTLTGYIAPYYTSIGNKIEYGTVTLTADTGWAHTWTDLPKVNKKGQRLHYTVEESPVPDGFHVIYSPNNQNGIQTGELVITNQSNGYVLPETGGTGTILFTTGGLALLALAGLMYIILRRKGDKQAL